MNNDVFTKFKGLGVALITPFKDDESVDFNTLEKLVNNMVANDVDYILALGTTSEYMTLTPDEKDDVLRCIVETNGNRKPIMVGLGGPNTAFMIRKLERLNNFPVDAILTVTPYYNKPSQAGLVAHYKKFASATDMPIFLYNVPGRTSCNLEVQTTLRIVEESKNIVGIKEASGNMRQILQLIAHKPDGFLVLSGDDLLAMPLIAAGADGLVSVMANAFPKDVATLVHATSNGNLTLAQQINNRLSDLTIACFKEGSPSGIKAILAAQNNLSHTLRLPLVPVSEQLQLTIHKLLNSLS